MYSSCFTTCTLQWLDTTYGESKEMRERKREWEKSIMKEKRERHT